MMQRQFRARVTWPLAALALGISTMMATPLAQAEENLAPGTITLVVPYTPGGTTDLLARRMAQGISEQLKRPVIVDNRPGAGTAIAASAVARAAPDGRTLLIASNATLAVNQHLGIKLAYSPEESFEYVSLLATVPNVVVTRPDSRWRSLKDVMATRGDGPAASYGSMGTGTSTHIAMEVLGQTMNAQLTHVPYKGSAPALVDLMGGHVDVVVDTLVATLPHLRETVEPAVLLALQRGALHACMEEIPRFALNIANLLALLASDSIQRAAPLALEPVEAKLGRVLVKLAVLDESGKCHVVRGITQDELGSMVGASRPWVNRALAGFERRGLIHRHKQLLTILDMAACRRLWMD